MLNETGVKLHNAQVSYIVTYISYGRFKSILFMIRDDNDMAQSMYSKTSVKWSLSKRPKIGFQDQLSLNEGQKYCRNILQCF